jgi:hypothetical protein
VTLAGGLIGFFAGAWMALVIRRSSTSTKYVNVLT